MKITWSVIANKLTSRKFWLAVATFVSGVLVLLKGNQTTADAVSGVILQLGAVIAYIAGEGYVDGQTAANTTGTQIAQTQPPSTSTADTATYTGGTTAQ